jgi:hypothetical protein
LGEGGVFILVLVLGLGVGGWSSHGGGGEKGDG